jgi:hypothetical protein
MPIDHDAPALGLTMCTKDLRSTILTEHQHLQVMQVMAHLHPITIRLCKSLPLLSVYTHLLRLA